MVPSKKVNLNTLKLEDFAEHKRFDGDFESRITFKMLSDVIKRELK
jgi:hypothetical protein